MTLADKKCIPCEGIGKTLTTEEAQAMVAETPDWAVKGKTIERDFKCKNFQEALNFVNKVGEIAESEGHHPDILIHGWNKVRLTLSTHALGGLTQNDFIVAAKINAITDWAED